MRKYLLAIILMVISLTACSHNVREEFDQSLRQYNDMFRWNELDTASMFVADSLREDFIARAKAANNLRIVDSRIVGARYDEKKHEASVDVRIDYYLISSARVKTLRDTQKWAYREERGVKGWRLMSPLPEFK